MWHKFILFHIPCNNFIHSLVFWWDFIWDALPAMSFLQTLHCRFGPLSGPLSGKIFRIVSSMKGSSPWKFLIWRRRRPLWPLLYDLTHPTTGQKRVFLDFLLGSLSDADSLVVSSELVSSSSSMYWGRKYDHYFITLSWKSTRMKKWSRVDTYQIFETIKERVKGNIQENWFCEVSIFRHLGNSFLSEYLNKFWLKNWNNFFHINMNW